MSSKYRELPWFNVDSRIGSSELLPDLLKYGVKAQLSSLEYGDFNFTGLHPVTHEEILIGIERKVVHDYVKSMRDNRLARQACGMAEMYHVRYLIIEGQVRTNDQGLLETVAWHREQETVGRGGDKAVKSVSMWKVLSPGGGGMSRRAGRVVTAGEFYNYALSLERIAGINLLQTVDIVDTVVRLHDMWKWYQKTEHTALGIEGLGDVIVDNPLVSSGMSVRPSITARFANEIDGIAGKRAREVAKYFKRPHNMTGATVEEWMRVPCTPRIGKTTAERIVKDMKG